MKRILFITSGPEAWASARMRAFWPAAHMEGSLALPFDQANSLPDEYGMGFDAFVFQKVLPTREGVELAHEQGKKVFWDVCDPLWWWSPNEVAEGVQGVDGIVCSSDNLMKDWYAFAFERGIQAHFACIPDRLELTHFPSDPLRKIYQAGAPVKLIWYGIAANRVALVGVLPYLERLAAEGLQIELTICDECPNWSYIDGAAFAVKNEAWNLNTEAATICRHDIALLPPYPGPWGHVKSNNKALTAYACGLPVVTGHDYTALVDLVKSQEARQIAAKRGWELVQREYRVEQSAEQWQELVK
jgi:hypothetical protein